MNARQPFSTPALPAENDPRLAGLADVLAHAPPEVHELIRRLAAMEREIGIGRMVQALAGEAILHGLPAEPDGLFDDDQSRDWHPLKGYGNRSCGQGGDGTGSREVPPFNLVPAPEEMPTVCLQTVVAIAHGTRAPKGLAMTLRLLREHLVRCGSGPKALRHRIAIVVTDAWPPQAVYESARDIAAHRDVAGLHVVVMHKDGSVWRPRRIR